MIFSPHYCSHYPILIKALQRSEGPVLEMGAGPFSTPLLHWMCIEMKRPLTSYDNDSAYFNLNHQFAGKNHKIELIKEWDDVDIESQHWGVAFLDHSPDYRRKEDAKRLVNNVDFLILHDSEATKDKYFGYSEIYPLFKYRYNYRRGSPFTVVLSNLKDVKEILRY